MKRQYQIMTVPNPEDSKERFYAMIGKKVAFRKPKKEKTAILRAVKRFADNWLTTLKENEEKLCYKDMVDYSKLF